MVKRIGERGSNAWLNAWTGALLCKAPAFLLPPPSLPMRLDQTELRGAWLIEPVPGRAHRGFFARTFCVQEAAADGRQTATCPRAGDDQSSSKASL